MVHFPASYVRLPECKKCVFWLVHHHPRWSTAWVVQWASPTGVGIGESKWPDRMKGFIMTTKQPFGSFLVMTRSSAGFTSFHQWKSWRLRYCGQVDANSATRSTLHSVCRSSFAFCLKHFHLWSKFTYKCEPNRSDQSLLGLVVIRVSWIPWCYLLWLECSHQRQLRMLQFIVYCAHATV